MTGETALAVMGAGIDIVCEYFRMPGSLPCGELVGGNCAIVTGGTAGRIRPSILVLPGNGACPRAGNDVKRGTAVALGQYILSGNIRNK